MVVLLASLAELRRYIDGDGRAGAELALDAEAHATAIRRT